jgi:hypothetical protein
VLQQMQEDFWKSVRHALKPFELFLRDVIATALGGFGMFLVAMSDLVESLGWKPILAFFGVICVCVSFAIAKWTKQERMKME